MGFGYRASGLGDLVDSVVHGGRSGVVVVVRQEVSLRPPEVLVEAVAGAEDGVSHRRPALLVRVVDVLVKVVVRVALLLKALIDT